MRCTVGVPLLLYLAVKLNSPVNRIVNKFVEKRKLLEVRHSNGNPTWAYNVFKEKYLNVTRSDSLEDWSGTDYSCDLELTTEFSSLVEEESNRFVEYLQSADDQVMALLDRDRVFLNKLMNISSGENTPRRKRKRSLTTNKMPSSEWKSLFSKDWGAIVLSGMFAHFFSTKVRLRVSFAELKLDGKWDKCVHFDHSERYSTLCT